MLKNGYDAGGKARKAWPEDCVWPKPLTAGEGIEWEPDLAEMIDLDEEGQELLLIKSYYDDLVERGVLNEDYTFNDNYDHQEELRMLSTGDDEDEDEDLLEFFPELGEEYWLDRFEVEMWEEDLNDHINLLKISMNEHDPAGIISETIGYSFRNENLLRQAFTRRAFAIEYGLSGCSEELEFIGDAVLEMAVTREIATHLAQIIPEFTEAPFSTRYSEGDFSRIRTQFVNKEHLAACARRSGLDKYILYGSGEEPGESSCEDMTEALIGAVAVDSGWDWDEISSVIDNILCIQLGEPNLLLKETFYDMFNAWHQKHFGCMPDYVVHGRAGSWCTIRFSVPENDKGVGVHQRCDAWAETRSRAREQAAELAYRFVTENGLWINLKDAGVVPKLEDSINQLQELYQKKYVEDIPVYRFTEGFIDTWECDCACGGVAGWGRGPNKTAAKKKAAYMVIVKLLDAAGICKEEWKEEMYR